MPLLQLPDVHLVHQDGDPVLGGVQQDDGGAVGRRRLPGGDVDLGDEAVEGSAEGGVVQGELGHLEGGLSLLHLGAGVGQLGRGRAGLQQVELSLGRVPLGLGGGDVRLGGPDGVAIGPGQDFVVLGLSGVEVLLGDVEFVLRVVPLVRVVALPKGSVVGDESGFVLELRSGDLGSGGGDLGLRRPGQELVTLGGGGGQMGLGGPQVGLRRSDFLGAGAGGDLGVLRLGQREGGLGLFHLKGELVIVEASQEVAGLHTVSHLHRYPGDGAQPLEGEVDAAEGLDGAAAGDGDQERPPLHDGGAGVLLLPRRGPAVFEHHRPGRQTADDEEGEDHVDCFALHAVLSIRDHRTKMTRVTIISGCGDLSSGGGCQNSHLRRK